MKSALVVLALAVAASALTDKQHWTIFKSTYGKVYANSTVENYRFQVFQANLRTAESLDAREPSAHFGVTKFSDMTQAEFRQQVTGNASFTATNDSSIPVFPGGRVGTSATTNWITKGLVSPVRDQGKGCAASWAFAAAGAAEGCFASVFGELVSLSVQQFLDCYQWTDSQAYVCDPCSTCDPDWGMIWGLHVGHTTWGKYGYIGNVSGSCKSYPIVLKPAVCKWYPFLKSFGVAESVLSDALTHSTVSVLLYAAPLQFYQGGPIKENCAYPTSDPSVLLTAAALLVADDGDEDTYVLKNSWGTDWGEEGFFRIQKNVDCLGVTRVPSVAYAA